MSCGKSEENNKCDGIICPTTAYCSDGMCILKEGRCVTKNDCTNDYICDVNFNCVNPNNPCEGKTCSNHGTCIVSNNLAQCNCETDYISDGLSCVAKPCTNGETKTSSCGPDGEVQSQICQYGTWRVQGACSCVNTSKRTQTCNGDGIQYQTCTDGIWINSGECIGTNCSTAGELRDIVCGFNGNGTQSQVCFNTIWTNTGSCIDSDVCRNGATQLIYDSVCANQSLNGRGQKEQFCVNGQWLDYEGNCKDPDVCQDGTETNCAAGFTCRVGQCVNCECDNWEICTNGFCLIKEGNCNENYDCSPQERCNTTTHLCEANSCSPVCNSWETCNLTTSNCDLIPGKCNTNSNCSNGKVCNIATHSCEFACNPACDSWETCNINTRECDLTEGSCNSNTDCNQGETCNLTTHTCNNCIGLSIETSSLFRNDSINGYSANISNSVRFDIGFYELTPVGTYSLTSTVNSNYQTCPQCVLIFDETNGLKSYFQSRGTLNITSGEPRLGSSSGNIVNVKLIQVTIDSATYFSTPVPNGGCYEIETAVWIQ